MNSTPFTPFQSEIKLRFRQTDAGGVMFFGQIFEIAHDIFEDFIVHAKIPYELWFGLKEVAVPVRSTHCEYFRPLLPGQIYQVQAWVSDLNESSLKMNYEILQNQKIHASVTMVHVFIDPHLRKRMNIPSLVRTQLSPFCIAEESNTPTES